jgi:protocatechuate 3,4-dioxygenase beta subunit
VYGTAYQFAYGYDGTTGAQTMSIDFNGDNSFGAGEVITQSSAFAGQGFKHFSIFMSGSATRTITLSNFVLNGNPLGTFTSPASGNIDKAWETNAGQFSNITATGSITFTGSGTTGDETGRVWFRTATPVTIPAASTCPQNYVINRVWTATDACGNKSQCVQNITVQDITAPVISGTIATSTIEACAVPAAVTTVAALEALGLSIADNCVADANLVVTSSDATSGTCPIVLTRTYTVTDACGNSSTAVQTINVDDTTAPVISGTIAASNLPGCDGNAAPAAVTTVAALEALGLSIADNCTADGDLAVSSSDVTAGSCPTVLTRTYTVTDACGNASTYVQTFNINDAVAPVITCAPNKTISCEESTLPANTGSASATDNCGTPAVTYSDAAGQLLPSTFPGGTSIQGRVRWGATGFEAALYNGSTVGQQLNPTGTPVWVYGTAYQFAYGYDGTTGAQTMSIDFNGDNSFGAGEVITQSSAFAGQGFKHFSIFMSGSATRSITLSNFVLNGNPLGTFTSPASGNIDKAWETNAGQFSNITATGSITFTGSGTTGDETGRVWFRTATPVSIPAASTCPQNYVINRVWTATDACGNKSQCVQNITVQDVTAPVISNVAGSLDQTVSCAADVPAANTSLINATDNCATPVITSADVTTAGSCANKFTVTRTYTATDACGNSSTFVQTITVNDQTAPVISNVAGSLNASVSCAADVPAANNSLINVTDNCAGVVSITSNDVTTPGTCANNFTVTRTYTATDVCGNASTFVQVITVNDNIAPLISGIITASNVAGCSASAAPAAVTTVAALEGLGLSIADNCTADGDLTVTSSDASAGSCPIVVTRTYTVTDACGNASTYVQTINVNDQVAPVTPTLADQTVLLCSATPVAPTTTDNCSGTVTGTTTTVFPLTTVGTTVVTWTFTDACGNSSTANQNVIVMGAPSTGAISGTSASCIPVAAGTGTYSVAAVPFVTSYSWTVPTGMTITSGHGTTSITVSWTSGAASTGIIGNVTVTPWDACGAGLPTTLNIGLTPVAPVTPGSISGNSKACPGDVVTYSVSAVARATSYNWVVPAFCSITSGQGTNVISVSFAAGFSGGNITVSAVNNCGSSPLRTRALGLNLPLTPAAISGKATGVCSSTTEVYTTTGSTAATSYVWTVPAGAVIVGASTGSTITVNFTAMGTNTGSITVKGVNSCGQGLARSLSISRLPARPLFGLAPTTAVCVGVNQTYQVGTVYGADSYNWTIPTVASLVSGQGTKTAVVNFTSAAIGNPNRVINVTATNGCGTGSVASTPLITVISCARLSDNNGFGDVNIYPNPTSERSTITFSSATAEDYTLSVTDISGRVLFEENRTSVIGLNQAELNLGGFSQGIYLVRVLNANNGISMRLIVE